MMVEECVKFMFMIWNLLLGYNSSSLVIFYFRYRPQSLGLQFLLLYLSIQLIPSYSPIFIHPDHPILLSYIYLFHSSHPILLYFIYPSAHPILLSYIYPLHSSHSTHFYLSVPLIPSCCFLFIRSAHPILLFYTYRSIHLILSYIHPFH